MEMHLELKGQQLKISCLFIKFHIKISSQPQTKNVQQIHTPKKKTESELDNEVTEKVTSEVRKRREEKNLQK